MKQRSLVISSTSPALQPIDWESAEAYAQNSRSRSTRRAYNSQWRRFAEWMTAHGGQPLPARPELVAAYLAERADQGAKPTTLAQALAAISEAHRICRHRSHSVPFPSASPEPGSDYFGVI